MKADEVRAMIDGGLHMGDDALEKGYVDGIMNEEQLIEYLGITKVTMWEEADGQILLPERDFSSKYVGVIYGGGTIVDGESATPPSDMPIPLPVVGGERLGDITLNQQVRNLMKDPQCGALVLYIDSGGGSATASESMASACGRVRQVASVSGPSWAAWRHRAATTSRRRAHWIVAQAGTITGSIGVLMGKLVNNEMLQKLHVNAFSYLRGDNADLMTGESPFSDAQRAIVRGSIEHIYELFLDRVAESRG